MAYSMLPRGEREKGRNGQTYQGLSEFRLGYLRKTFIILARVRRFSICFSSVSPLYEP